MPQLGESIAEGTIVKWLKEVGDSVKKDENVLLISTDKVEAEIPAPCDGVLVNILVKASETVAVGSVLGQVGEKGESVIAAKPVTTAVLEATPVPKIEVKTEVKACSMQSQTQEIKQDTSPDMSKFFSPLVKKIASEKNVTESELGNINGSGIAGRVSKKDLLDYLDNRLSVPKSNDNPISSFKVDFSVGQKEESRPISSMRKAIIDNMIASRKTSAHVTTFFEIDYTNIDKIRAKYKESFKAQEGVSLTYTTFLAAAVCQVLRRHPYINASLTQDKIIFKQEVHLGIAVSIEQPEPGLMVPVIKHADKQSLRGLAHTINDLSTRVRTKKIKPDELSGGSFTITNPGNYGAIIGTPIINQPQVAILGVGQIKKSVQVIEIDGQDTIAIRNTGLLSLSFDHRLIDGATADIFMADLQKTLQTWNSEP